MRAFTLVELLVSVAIIALLLAILSPALGSAWRAGRSVKPIHSDHVLGKDAKLFAARFDDREHLFGPLCSCTMLGPKGPDRLLAIVLYVLLQELSVGPTRRHNNTCGQPKAPA